MRTYPALLLASLLVATCNDSPTQIQGAALSFETLARVSSSGFTEPQRRSVRSDGEWQEVWQTLHLRQSPVPARPAVDFARDTVVLAAAGTRDNGCFAIEVTAARLTAAGALQLDVVESVPGPTCVCIQSLTQPVHVIKVERAAAVPSFVERVQELRC